MSRRKTKGESERSAPATPIEADKPAPRVSKLATLIALLQAADGVPLAALCEATGWQRHSVRGAMAGALKRKGYRVTSLHVRGGPSPLPDWRAGMTRKATLVEDEVRALAHLDLQGLRFRWSQQFGPAPKLRSVELLRLMLAWRMQVEAFGGIDLATRRALERKTTGIPEGRSHGHGAVFRRIWQGRVIEAVVETDGFRFEGTSYRSLSAVAEAATGTRWNGPRFFGLRSDGKSKEARS